MAPDGYRIKLKHGGPVWCTSTESFAKERGPGGASYLRSSPKFRR